MPVQKVARRLGPGALPSSHRLRGFLDWWDVNRRWQKIDHGVEQVLHAFVFECCSAQRWDDGAGNAARSQRFNDVLFGDFVTFQVFLSELIIAIRAIFRAVFLATLRLALACRRECR